MPQMGPKTNSKIIEIRRTIRGRVVIRNVPIGGFVSPPEAAAMLRVGLRHVYRLMKHKQLPRKKRQGHNLIPCQAVIQRLTQKGGDNYAYKTRTAK